jgi:hypothetical protein
MNRQLSLFNTNAATGNLYKAGDWVKVQRKPAQQGLNRAKSSKSTKYTQSTAV